MENITIIQTEDLKDPDKLQSILDSIYQKLQISPYLANEFLRKKFNVAPSLKMDSDIYQELAKFYEPYTKQLESYLGRSFNWK